MDRWLVFEHIRVTCRCRLGRCRAAERTLLHSRSCSLSAFSLFLSRSAEAHPVPPSSRQAPSPLPRTRINSCTQIPLKILSPGCHLFSRGPDQIGQGLLAEKKKGGHLCFNARPWEHSDVRRYSTARASASSPDTRRLRRKKKKDLAQKSYSSLGFKVKCVCLYGKK